MFVMCVLEGEDQVRGRNVVVHAGWTVDITISKDSSVVEHLTSDTVIPGSIPGPTVNFHLYFFVPVHSSHSYYNYIII